MIKDEKIGLKVAEDKDEALAIKTADNIEENNRQMLFQIELNNVMLAHLKSKIKEVKK